jgi:hypothetical protein
MGARPGTCVDGQDAKPKRLTCRLRDSRLGSLSGQSLLGPLLRAVKNTHDEDDITVDLVNDDVRQRGEH